MTESEIHRQILMAHAWADNNPGRAPRKDIMRYLNNWMQIADRKGSMRRGPKAPAAIKKDEEPDMSYEEARAIRIKNMGAK